MHTGKGCFNLLDAGFVYCFFLALLSAFGTVPQRKLHSDHKWIISQLVSRGQPGFGRMLWLQNEILYGAEPRQNEEDATHNKPLCKQVLLKQPYRSDATLYNIVTNPYLRAVSCLSPPCKPCRHGTSLSAVEWDFVCILAGVLGGQGWHWWVETGHRCLLVAQQGRVNCKINKGVHMCMQ